MSPTAAAANPPRGPLARAGSFVLGMFTRNLPVKLAALVLALLVWYTVRKDLTDTYPSEGTTVVRLELDEGLMLRVPPPRTVDATFEGPTSQINILRRQERTEIRIRIRKDDLLGQAGATLKFSPERGNIQHPYGPEVRIASLSPNPIVVEVAERAEREVTVNKPAIKLGSREWKVDLNDLVAPKVRLTGPKAVLSALDSVTPVAIDADRILEGVQDESYGPTIRQLSLPPELTDRQVELARGEDSHFRVSLTFVRSLTSTTFDIPLYALERENSDVTLAVTSTGLDQRADGTFVVPVQFTGTPTTLARLEEEIKKGGVGTRGRVWAYVLADDIELKSSEPWRGSPTAVYVHVPEEFWGHVTPSFTDFLKVFLTAKKKEPR